MKNEPIDLELPKQEMGVTTRAPGGNSDNLMAVLDRAARDPNCDPDRMERILGMVERVRALDERDKQRAAEVAFNKAMADAQAEMPRVLRDAQNQSTSSRYTRLETLHAKVVPVITQHGFSMSFGTADCPKEGQSRVTCIVSHRDGHSRPYQLDMPNDNLGPKGLPNKTLVHGLGSSMSYGRRYLTLMIFNVALTNEDDDANAAGRRAQPVSGQATEKTRAWFLSQIADIAEQAKHFAVEKGWLAPDEELSAWPLAHVPVSKATLAALRSDIMEWGRP